MSGSHRYDYRFSTALAVVAAFAATSPAQAQLMYRFDIPAEDLGTALQAFARVTHAQLAYDNGLVKNKKNKALVGTYSTKDGLNALLSGSGLSTRRSAEGVYTVTPAPVAENESDPEPNGAGAMDDILIVGHARPSDVVNNIPVPIIETTQKVTLVTADDIRTLGMNNFNDIAKLDSGSQIVPVRSGYTALYFRGFISDASDFPLKIDGFRSSGAAATEMYIYDSVQIIKGSAATNYGAVDPGGVMVAISKSPKDHFGGEVSVSGGSYRRFEGDFDIYGPLTSNGALSGRVVGVAYTSSSPFQYLGEKRLTLAPSLRWRPSDRDELLLLTSYTQVTDAGVSVGFPLQLNANGPGGANNGANYSIPDLPFSRLALAAPWGRMNKYYNSESLTYTHTFPHSSLGNMKLKVGFEHYGINRPHNAVPVVGGYTYFTPDKTQPTDIYLYYSDNHAHQWAGEISLTDEFKAFGQDNFLYLGADYSDSMQGYEPYSGLGLPGSTSGFNVYQNNWSAVPGYRSMQQFVANYGPPGFSYSYNEKDINYGVEGQVILRPTKRAEINLGARYSVTKEYRKEIDNYPDDIEQKLPPYTLGRPSQDAFTYQLGASYEIVDHLRAYASYGTSFLGGSAYGFVNNSDPIGRFLGIVKGLTYEAGLKGESASKTFSYSLDVFNTEVTNAFQKDVFHPRYAVAVGRQRARGVEAELKGRITPEFSVLMDASTTRNVYTGGPLKGYKSPFAPKFGLSIYPTYEFQSGPLRGFSVGGGLMHKDMPRYQVYSISAGGTQFVDLSSAINPHINVVDLHASYRRASWLFEVSCTNLFNERYAAARNPNFAISQIYINDPRWITARITKKL